jgi:hypothetical protein
MPETPRKPPAPDWRPPLNDRQIDFIEGASEARPWDLEALVRDPDGATRLQIDESLARKYLRAMLAERDYLLAERDAATRQRDAIARATKPLTNAVFKAMIDMIAERPVSEKLVTEIYVARRDLSLAVARLLGEGIVHLVGAIAPASPDDAAKEG